MFTVANIFAFLVGRRRLVPSGHLGSSRFVQTTLMNSGLIEMVKSIIPPLTYNSHKGDAGRIGVIGGSQDYTGAPYFAAISSLKLGADLSHVFCAKDAASVIKSYSPELIVHPVLDLSNVASEVDEWLPRLHAVVLGPGLGRNDKIISNAKTFIEKIKKLGIPIVIDADGLYLVTEYPEIIKDYTKAILTPNVVEFSRLYQKMLGRKPSEDEPVNNVKRLSQQLGYVTIVQKGENDIISNGTQDKKYKIEDSLNVTLSGHFVLRTDLYGNWSIKQCWCVVEKGAQEDVGVKETFCRGPWEPSPTGPTWL